jgi:hypothetical protein
MLSTILDPKSNLTFFPVILPSLLACSTTLVVVPTQEVSRLSDSV